VKSSTRNLLLVPHTGMINKKRRYYSLRSALNAAIKDVVETKSPTVIYDTARGVDIASVRLTIGQVRVYIDSPGRFRNLWSR